MTETMEACKAYFEGKRIAVLGVGISNRPLIRFLFGLEARITAFDALPSDDRVLSKTRADFEAEGIRIEWNTGDGYLDALPEGEFDLIFRTPKMRPDLPQIVSAVSRGAVLTSEMEVFMTLCPGRIFAVTGSDGKTTTTTLIAKMLEASGFTVHVGGNIGTPLLSQIEFVKSTDMVVLELSSFQLLTMTKSADIAVVTNVTPNHLDVHKSYEEYIEAKENIFRNQDFRGRLVINAHNDITFQMAKKARGEVSFFSLDYDSKCDGNFGRAYLHEGILVLEQRGKAPISVLDERDILIPGLHNVENYLAAMSAVVGFASVESMKQTALTFSGVEHRIELVRTLNGVRYYNSSIDTSPNRTINTMNALERRGESGVLIAGGADKKCIYKGLGDAILRVCNRIILYGSNAQLLIDIIEKEADGRTFLIEEATDYKDAVSRAKELAKEGEIVILSPTGTSYDHFRHFEERGNLFKKLVGDLSESE